MAFTEDFAPFFQEFATAATLGGKPVKVIFDKAALLALGGTVEDAGPQALIRTADAAGVAYGSTCIIGSTTYSVRGIEPDGTGLTTLQLRQ